MATQTLKRPQEFTDKGFHPLVEATMLVEAVEVEEETQSATTMAMVTFAPVPTSKDAMLVRIGRALLGFHDRLSGPPMSKRDRLHLYLESTAIFRQIGPMV